MKCPHWGDIKDRIGPIQKWKEPLVLQTQQEKLQERQTQLRGWLMISPAAGAAGRPHPDPHPPASGGEEDRNYRTAPSARVRSCEQRSERLRKVSGGEQTAQNRNNYSQHYCWLTFRTRLRLNKPKAESVCCSRVWSLAEV